MTTASSRPIFIVLAGGLILDAYTNRDSAELHRKCVTGADVVSCELRDQVPDEIREDLSVEWNAEESDDTPVMDVDDLDDR